MPWLPWVAKRSPQIGRLGLGLEEAISRSFDGKVVPLAARCSVHCKSDITHKLNRHEASVEDVLRTGLQSSWIAANWSGVSSIPLGASACPSPFAYDRCWRSTPDGGRARWWNSTWPEAAPHASWTATSIIDYFRQFIREHELEDLFIFDPQEANDSYGLNVDNLDRRRTNR